MYPALFSIPRPERSSRILVLIRPIICLPQKVWATVYSAGALLILAAGWLSILVSGRFPRGLWRIIEEYFRFTTRLSAYLMLLTDAYPPFSGSPDSPYPVGIHVDYPARMSRLNALFRGLLLIPQIFFGAAYSFVIAVVMGLTVFAVLILGRIPDACWSPLRAYVIWNARLNAYALLLVDEYPPFHGVQPLAAETVFSGGV